MEGMDEIRKYVGQTVSGYNQPDRSMSSSRDVARRELSA